MFLLLVAWFLMAPFFVWAQDEDSFHPCFFKERSFAVGAAVEYAFAQNQTGGQTRLYYNLTHNICLGPELSRLSGSQIKSTDLNFVIHYVHEVMSIGVYPVGGISFSTEREADISEKTFRPLLGLGAHRNWRKMTFFSEYAHLFSGETGDKVSVGILYMFQL